MGNAFTPFRIDHDERFNQTTHFQYQPWQRGPWVGFNWRYDSGLVAGECRLQTPLAPSIFLDSPQISNFRRELFCGNTRPTLSQPLALYRGLRLDSDQLTRSGEGKR